MTDPQQPVRVPQDYVGLLTTVSGARLVKTSWGRMWPPSSYYESESEQKVALEAQPRGCESSQCLRSIWGTILPSTSVGYTNRLALRNLILRNFVDPESWKTPEPALKEEYNTGHCLAPTVSDRFL